jgi:divalent metal cation (Fe/Co/Zn/Cd) transporter
LRKELIISLVLLALTIALYLSLSLMEDPRAATFPRFVIIIMGVLSVALFFQSVISKQKVDKPALQSDRVNEKKDSASGKSFPIGTLLGCFVLIVVYFFVMEQVGFYVSAFLFFTAATFLLGRKDLTVRKGGTRIGVAFIFTAVLFFLFNKLLLVQTPKGMFF